MDILVVLIPIALLLGGVFALLFVLAVRAGQFDDLDDPPLRVLQDEQVDLRATPPRRANRHDKVANHTHIV